MTLITLTQEQVDAMLEEGAAVYGYSLEQLRELAHTGELIEPELRDLWIIWGDDPLNTSAA